MIKEANLEALHCPRWTSFATIVNHFQMLTIVKKVLILDIAPLNMSILA